MISIRVESAAIHECWEILESSSGGVLACLLVCSWKVDFLFVRYGLLLDILNLWVNSLVWRRRCTGIKSCFIVCGRFLSSVGPVLFCFCVSTHEVTQTGRTLVFVALYHFSHRQSGTQNSWPLRLHSRERSWRHKRTCFVSRTDGVWNWHGANSH